MHLLRPYFVHAPPCVTCAACPAAVSVLVGDVDGGVVVPGPDIPCPEFSHPRFRVQSVG